MIHLLAHILPWVRPTAALPAMEGVLRPNQALDQARLLAEYPSPDNLVWQDDHLLFTSGNRILLVDSLHDGIREPEEILRFDTDITAMAAAGDGSLAVGLGAAGVSIVGGRHDGRAIASLGGNRLICPTALCFADPDTLFVCIGSGTHAPDEWQQDLLVRRASGSLWRVRLDGSDSVCLATQLAFPAGLLLRGDRRIAVAEAGRYRVLEFPSTERNAPRILLDELPGCPGRMAPASDGGAWLAVFAIGLSKTRALSHSYGLAIRLDQDFRPTASLHGRADGHRHGVTSCLEARGELFVACRGDNALLSADLTREPGN